MNPSSPDRNSNKRLVPHHLVTTACISTMVTIILSGASIFLSVFILMSRYNCKESRLTYYGSEYFMYIVIRTFILYDGCSDALKIENLTPADSVYEYAIATLVLACSSYLMCIVMINALLKDLKGYKYYVYGYIIISMALLVLDLTFGVHFGTDTQVMKAKMDRLFIGNPANYKFDMIRLGAMMLMSFALKGIAGHAINFLLLVILALYTFLDQEESLGDDHPIQRFDAIRAFESPNLEDQRRPQGIDGISVLYSRGPSMNMLNDDGEQQARAMREPSVVDISRPLKQYEDQCVPIYRTETSGYPKGDYSNVMYSGEEPRRVQVSMKESTSDRICGRSPSWLHNSGALQPFSYLENPKRPLPVKPPTAATTEPEWRRSAWPPTPVVPDPDYSPPPRRLKSALKSNYN